VDGACGCGPRRVDQAHHLAARIEREPLLELMAPVGLDIVCFRAHPEGWSEERLDALNRELLMRTHESGVAVPSYTTLGGRYCLRVAVSNHRSTHAGFDHFVQELLAMVPQVEA
jgi:aromatic-L-amino-acid/L-tryptophan decarboxylase